MRLNMKMKTDTARIAVVCILLSILAAAAIGVSATDCTTCTFPTDAACWCGKELSRVTTDTAARICPAGQGVMGIAADAGANPITILCGRQLFWLSGMGTPVSDLAAPVVNNAVLNTDYVPLLFSSQNPLGMRTYARAMGDWAVNHYKYECPAGYVVAGFTSNVTPGAIPFGAITQMNCAKATIAPQAYTMVCDVVQWASVGLNSAGVLLPPFGGPGGIYQSNYLKSTHFLVGVAFSSVNYLPEYYMYCNY